jgi:hypothetical protein
MAHISHVCCCCFCLSIVNVVLELLKTSNKSRLDTRGMHSLLANALRCLWIEEVSEMVLCYVAIGNIYGLRRLHQMVGLGFRKRIRINTFNICSVICCLSWQWGKANGRGYGSCLSAFLVPFYV